MDAFGLLAYELKHLPQGGRAGRREAQDFRVASVYQSFPVLGPVLLHLLGELQHCQAQLEARRRTSRRRSGAEWTSGPLP